MLLTEDTFSRRSNTHFSFKKTLDRVILVLFRCCLGLVVANDVGVPWHLCQFTLILVILQVLLSIQALVLNQRPFFNEPGFYFFTSQRWEEESLAYNENAFLLCCRTTLALLRTPPKDFEPLVTAHFRQRGTTILKTCVKQFNKPSIPRTRTAAPNSTEKFKESLVIVYPQLCSAFAGTGASLRDLPLQLGPTPGKETGQHATAAVAVKPATKLIQKPGTTKVVTGKVKVQPTQKPGTAKGVFGKVKEFFLGFVKEIF